MNDVVIQSLAIVLGLLFLWWGSDYGVKYARRIARTLGVSDLIIGLTITSIGTSLPEISTALIAGVGRRQGLNTGGLAVGDIIGSNLGQISLILGISGFYATLFTSRSSLRRDGGMLWVALFAMFLAAADGMVSRLEGAALALVYLGYLVYLARNEQVLKRFVGRGRQSGSLLFDGLRTLVGLAVVVAGAQLVVNNGVALAESFGVDAYLVGLFVGLGTSLPELSVSLRALVKQAGHLSLGNLIGSNITDPLFSFGVGAAVAPIAVNPSVLRFDFVFWMLCTATALLLLSNDMRLNRTESSVLILLYLMFMYLRVSFV